MNRALSTVVLALGVFLLTGCATSHAVPYLKWKGTGNEPVVIEEANGDAVIAGAAALRAVIDSFGADSELFTGCETPAQGLSVRVLSADPTTKPPAPYFTVFVEQAIERCGDDAIYRVLDWHEIYAVTRDGTVLGRARAR